VDSVEDSLCEKFGELVAVGSERPRLLDGRKGIADLRDERA